jgi:hypothetical protein
MYPLGIVPRIRFGVFRAMYIERFKLMCSWRDSHRGMNLPRASPGANRYLAPPGQVLFYP